jgi:hypothetical protein
MGCFEKVNVGAQVLAQELHPEAPPSLGPVGRADGQALVSLGFHPPELTEQVR